MYVIPKMNLKNWILFTTNKQSIKILYIIHFNEMLLESIRLKAM